MLFLFFLHMTDLIDHTITPQGIATVTLKNSQHKNAITERMNDALIRLFQMFCENPDVRVIVLQATGDTFCSGIDLQWMIKASEMALNQNIDDAKQYVTLLKTIDICTKPTIALVQGHCYGAGVGFLSVCDIAICAPHVMFSFPEVARGLIPSVVAPYIMRVIGQRQLKRLILTGMSIAASDAHYLGLIHEVVHQDLLESHCQKIIMQLLRGAPFAQAAAKDLLHYIATRPNDQVMLNETARRLGVIRASKEAQKGMQDFFNKKRSEW